MYKKRKGFTLIELMIVIAIIAILAAILIPNFVRARAQGQLAACKSNLKNIGTALEMYSADSSGIYPVGTVLASITVFTPSYMTTVPTCAVAGAYAYSTAPAATPTMYTVNCISTVAGNSHSGITVDGFPQYSPTTGLRDTPGT